MLNEETLHFCNNKKLLDKNFYKNAVIVTFDPLHLYKKNQLIFV